MSERKCASIKVMGPEAFDSVLWIGLFGARSQQAPALELLPSLFCRQVNREMSTIQLHYGRCRIHCSWSLTQTRDRKRRDIGRDIRACAASILTFSFFLIACKSPVFSKCTTLLLSTMALPSHTVEWDSDSCSQKYI